MEAYTNFAEVYDTFMDNVPSVSYTHLTLPTTERV